MDKRMQDVLSRLDMLEKEVEALRIAFNENVGVMNETIAIMNERESIRDQQFDFLHGRVMTPKERAVRNSKMEAERKQRGQDNG